jgi:hypothetical protein
MSELFKELLKESGYFHKAVDRRGGILEIRKTFLEKAKKRAKGKTPEEAAVIGWNEHCDYNQIHSRYNDSFRLWSDRNPPCNY